MLVFSMISSSEKNYKYFIGYKDDDYETILPKNSVKSLYKKLCKKRVCKKL